MLKSMTGFGRSEKQNETCSCKVEIRSVNNRYIEINARLPKALSQLEHPLRKLIKSRCARGSFDITITLEKENGAGSDQKAVPNMALAAQYVGALRQIKNELGLSGEIDINSIITLRDIVKFQPVEVGSGEDELILETTGMALDALITMRTEEGKNLQKDILDRIESVKDLGRSITELQPQILQKYKERLKEKIQSLTEGLELDEVRLAQETAILADRCDITEEVIRLESHIQQFKQYAQSEEPAGRKMEFITQEINRETNTIGSKSINHQVSQWAVEIKSLLEKIREQLQNIE